MEFLNSNMNKFIALALFTYDGKEVLYALLKTERNVFKKVKYNHMFSIKLDWCAKKLTTLFASLNKTSIKI